MENIDVLISFFSDQNLLFKIGLVVLIAIYSLFALIVAVQIRNLNRIINQINFSPLFTLAAFLHLGITVALLLFAVVFL